MIVESGMCLDMTNEHISLNREVHSGEVLRMKKLLMGVAIILSGVSSSFASPGDKYKCVVDKFGGTGEYDKNFVDLNLSKTFLISEEKDHLLVSFSAPKPLFGQSVYTIFKKSISGIFGIRKESAFLDSIVLAHPTKPEISATLVIQSTFFINTWLLDCQKK